MEKKTKLSKRSIALLTAALLLLACSTVTGTKAALSVQSDEYTAEFYMNHLQVHLMENGKDVCGGKNTVDGTHKATGELATTLGYSRTDESEKLGSFEPGRVYKEELAAKNGQEIDEFVRVTVRKFWVRTDEDGGVVREDNGDPVKDTRLSPDLIRLTYGKDSSGKKAYDLYNKDAWARNADETTSESATYYLKKALAGGKTSEPLFDRVMIDGSVAKLGSVEETTEGDYTVYTYEYEYDGTAFFIEAEAQAIQTHNANDAIKSQWGVGNVKADGSSLSVR